MKMTTLSSLPPELLRDIIESAVPPTFHSTTYKERKTTLCSLSLVSRQFRTIAQPLLLEIVCIKWDKQLEVLLKVTDGFVGIKEVIVGPDASSKMVEWFSRRWKGIQSLTISQRHEDPFDLEVLVQHTTLVNFQLSGCGFHSTVCAPLTTLRSLTLDYRALDSSVPLLLDPGMLPSPQALGLINVIDEEELQQLEETNISRLLPQLDAIVISSILYRLGINGLFSGYSSRILIGVLIGSLDSPTLPPSLTSARHVRIQQVTTFTFEASAAIRSFLTACRESENSSLKSIYLPLEWHPSRRQSPAIVTEMKQVMEVSEKAGIELVFESQPNSFLDKFISREFWDRQRRTRKEEEQR